MEITKISTKTQKVGGNTLHMYTIVTGKGSKRTSVTGHMTEAQASIMRKA